MSMIIHKNVLKKKVKYIDLSNGDVFTFDNINIFIKTNESGTCVNLITGSISSYDEDDDVFKFDNVELRITLHES